MQFRSLGFALMMSTALAGCATFKPPEIGYDDEQPAEPAVLQGEPARPLPARAQASRQVAAKFLLKRCHNTCRAGLARRSPRGLPPPSVDWPRVPRVAALAAKLIL